MKISTNYIIFFNPFAILNHLFTWLLILGWHNKYNNFIDLLPNLKEVLSIFYIGQDFWTCGKPIWAHFNYHKRKFFNPFAFLNHLFTWLLILGWHNRCNTFIDILPNLKEVPSPFLYSHSQHKMEKTFGHAGNQY